jgi:peptidoglycan hydrolase-like protein with peptidoglycan-binding domain
MTYPYTNAQIRSILNGLGYRNPDLNEFDFPLSSDNSPLKEAKTVQAIKDFQSYFGLVPDGVVGSNTKAKVERQMYIIHYELDLVMKPNPPLRPQNIPLYGPQTAQAVNDFRRRYGFEPDRNINNDRVADLPVRRQLDELTLGILAAA